jgi:HEAT repeat protein
MGNNALRKYFLVLFLACLTCNSRVYLYGENEMGKQDLSDVEIENTVREYMKQFRIIDSTRNTQMKAVYDIQQKIGLKALPSLLKGVIDNDKEVRLYSVIALQDLIGKRIIREIKKATTPIPLSLEEAKVFNNAFAIIINATQDSYHEVRKQALWTLALFDNSQAIPTIQKAFHDNDREVREFACLAMRALDKNIDPITVIKAITQEEPKVASDYIKYLKHESTMVLESAKVVLRRFGKQAIPALLKVASSDKEPGRQRAIKLLGEIKAEEAIPVLGENFKREPNDTSSLYALAHIGTPEAIDILVQYGLKHKDANVKMNTAKALLPEHRNIAIPFLKELAKHKDGKVRLETGRMLVEQKEQAGIPVLIELTGEFEYFRLARTYLANATGQTFDMPFSIISTEVLQRFRRKWEKWWRENESTFEFK